MKVTCPECHFSSEIPDNKIPENAQLATCPKCQIKFQFRDLSQNSDSVPDMNFDDNSMPEENQDHQTSAHENQQRETENQTINKNHKQVDASAEQPPVHAQNDEEPDFLEHPNAEEINTKKEDIWQRLDAMKPKNQDDQNHGEEDYPQADPVEIPFENLEKYGFFPGLFLTIKKVLLSPASFFSGMELKGFIKPLIFFILLAEFQEICNFIWTTAGVDSTIGSDMGRIVNDSIIADSLNDGTTSALFSLLLYPLMLAGISFPLISVTHVLLMIFGAGDRGYQATFRATAYSYAPIILCVIPLVGDMIGAIGSVAISIIAYKNIHNTTYMRVVLSMVMPVVLLLVILGFYMNFNQPTI